MRDYWQHFGSLHQYKGIYSLLKITHMSNSKIITGLLIGAAAGAVAGILFAPEKGSVTRQKITESGSDFASELKNRLSELVDNLTNKFDKAQAKAGELAASAGKNLHALTQES